MAKPTNPNEVVDALLHGKTVYCTPENYKPILSLCARNNKAAIADFTGTLIVVQGIFIND
jgi:hypothetical protein